jgi:hypothetical protein
MAAVMKVKGLIRVSGNESHRGFICARHRRPEFIVPAVADE